MCDEEEKNTEKDFKDGNEVVGTDREAMVTKENATTKKEKKTSSDDTKRTRRKRVTFYVTVPGQKRRKKVTFLARR